MSEDSPLMGAEPSPRVAVRNNLWLTIAALRVSHVQFCLSFTLYAPQIVAIACVLAAHWDPQACNAPLHYWAVAYGARLALGLFTTVLPFLRQSAAVRAVHATCLELLNLLSFGLFVSGSFWLFEADDRCYAESGAVVKLVAALLSINCALMFAPFLCLCLCCPLLLCFTPMLLRSLAGLAELTQQRRGLSQRAIAQLPVIKFPPRDNRHEWPAECSICLAAFRDGDQCVQLECHPSHCFHADCCQNWLKINGTCPICRAVVPGDIEGASDDVPEALNLIDDERVEQRSVRVDVESMV